MNKLRRKMWLLPILLLCFTTKASAATNFNKAFMISTVEMQSVEITMASQENVSWLLTSEELGEFLSSASGLFMEAALVPTQTLNTAYTFHCSSQKDSSRFTVDDKGLVTLLSANPQSTQIYYQLSDYAEFTRRMDLFLSSQSQGYQVHSPSVDQSYAVSDWASSYFDSANKFSLLPSHLQVGFLGDNITREVFCDIIMRLLERTVDFSVDPFTSNTFVDTNNINLVALRNAGLIYGKDYNNFKPNDFLTREQAAVILGNVAIYLDIPPSHYQLPYSFADGNTISNWALNSIDFIVNIGVMTGTEDGFSPKNNLTKEQSIIAIMNLYRAYAISVVQ